MNSKLRNLGVSVKLLLALIFCLTNSIPMSLASASWSSSKVADENTINEGVVSKVVLTVGPFDIHRRYLSMEGPWVSGKYKAGDLLASKTIEFPEGMVNYLENGDGAASMQGGGASKKAGNANPIGLIERPRGKRELYWFKGVKLEVLDENNIVQPTAEFICHWNLDVDPDFRNRVFTEGHKSVNSRLSSISQGETTQILPQGYAVPISSDEPLQVSFQAANRTTDAHRRIRHRCTLYFVKDSDLYYPIKALYFYVPYITVVTDKNSPELSTEQKKFCPVCVGTSPGVDAPNDKIGGTFHDEKGRTLSGHWVIPPGEHTYRDVVGAPRDIGFQQGNPVIRAAWTHVHPLCTKLSLIECTKDNRTSVISTNCKTKTSPGLQIMKLDFIAPKGGAQLHETSQYELEVTYNNPFTTAVDSMASMGIYMEDPNFARPRWALHDFKAEEDFNQPAADNLKTQMSCAISHGCANTAAVSSDLPADIASLPLFDQAKDGPVLNEIKTVRLDTNAGPIMLRLDPTLAPATATQIYKLLCSGAYKGTRIPTYESNFLLSIANIENKSTGEWSNEARPKLRRLPLEVTKQKQGQLNHRPHVLSMARYNTDNNSGTSSFSILLGNAPQLDHQYTIFGTIGEDPATLETIAKMESHWDSNSYSIIDAKPVTNTELANSNH